MPNQPTVNTKPMSSFCSMDGQAIVCIHDQLKNAIKYKKKWFDSSETELEKIGHKVQRGVVS